MHHFFIDPSMILADESRILIDGDNFHHLTRVLRARPGERILISDGEGTDYECELEEIRPDTAVARICFREASHELPADLYLFQGLPKQDKMELILEKAVELGARAVVPVATRNTVVRLDEKKGARKLEKWRAVARAAAEQSKRSILPEVPEILPFREALSRMPEFALKLIPYENADDAGVLRRELGKLPELLKGETRPKVAVFIGPEGGFTEEEIVLAEEMGVVPVSLGRRILRTETAAITMMSLLMMTLEESGKEL